MSKMINVHCVLISEEKQKAHVQFQERPPRVWGRPLGVQGRKVGSQAASHKYNLFLRVRVPGIHNFPCLENFGRFNTALLIIVSFP